MKKSVFYYFFSELKREKGFYFWNFISYCVLIGITVFIGLFGTSFVYSYSEYLDKQYGEYDFCLMDVEAENEVFRSYANGLEFGRCFVTGYANLKGNKNASIGFYDDAGYQKMSVQVLEGRLPQNGYEVAVEESVLYQLSIRGALPQTITLNTYDLKGNSCETVYEVVGIIRNYTQRTPDPSDKQMDNPFYLFPSIITKSCTGEESIVHALLSNVRGEDILSSECFNFLLNVHKRDQQPTFLYVGLGIVFLIFLALGIVNLYCSVLLNRKKNQEQLFQKKCAGATNRECISLQLYKLTVILIVAVIVGLAVGIISAWEIIRLVRRFGADYLELRFSAPIVGISIAVTAFFIIVFSIVFEVKDCKRRPLETNIDKRQDAQRFRMPLRRFIRHPLYATALQNVYVNTPKYVSIILSVAFMLFSSTVVQTLVTGISQNYSSNIQNDFFIKTPNGATVTSLAIPLTSNGFESNDIVNLMESGELLTCYAYSENRMYIKMDSNAPNPPSKWLENQKDQYLYSHESLQRVEQEYELFGYGKSDKLYRATLYGVNEMLWQTLSESDEFLPNEILLLVLTDFDYYKDGDSLLFTAPRFREGQEVATRVDIEVEVGKVIRIDEKSPFYNICSEKGYAFCAMQELIDEKINPGYQYMVLNLVDQTKYHATEKILEQLGAVHSNDLQYELISNREQNEEKKKVVALSQVIGALIIGTVFLYFFVNTVTVFRNDLYSRRKTWGYFKAGGLNLRQAVKIQGFTVAILVLLALMLSLLLIGILMIVFKKSDRELVIAAMSPLSIIVPAVFSLIISQVVTLMVLKRFWKQPVIALLR